MRRIHQHSHPALQQTGGHHIGLFCPSYRFEGRARAVPDEFLHIVGVQHAVDLHFAQTAAQPLQNPGLHHPFHIADAKSGFGLFAHLGKFEFQMGGADLPADHGDAVSYTHLAQENGVRPTMIDRLRLDEGRVRSMAEGARQVAQLPDPTGNVLETIHRPNGMVIEKVSVPMGVIGIIYEARPNVTVDSAVLCFKAGSAAFLRGGKEAFFSNTQLAKVMRSALEQEGLCPDCVILLDDTSRETAQPVSYTHLLLLCAAAQLLRSV